MTLLHPQKITLVDELMEEDYTVHKEIQCTTCSTNSGERSQPNTIGNKKGERDFKIMFKRLKKIKDYICKVIMECYRKVK